MILEENFDVLLLSETHLLPGAKLTSAVRKLRKAGFSSIFHSGCPTVQIDRETVDGYGLCVDDGVVCARPLGEEAMATTSGASTAPAACSAGVAVIWRSGLKIDRVDSGVLSSALPSLSDQSRVIPVYVRLKSVSILLVEVYLHDGVGLDSKNVGLLERVACLLRMVGCPVIVMGDFQITADELQASEML